MAKAGMRSPSEAHGKGKNAGFSYIEVLIAMALLSIIFAPLLPILSQASMNQAYAISRRQAQGYAAAMALKARSAPETAGQIVRQAAADNEQFIYRLSLVSLDGISREYIEGKIALAGADTELALPPGGASIHTAFGDFFEDVIFIVAEVFDSNGNLAGLSVSKSSAYPPSGS